MDLGCCFCGVCTCPIMWSPGKHSVTIPRARNAAGSPAHTACSIPSQPREPGQATVPSCYPSSLRWGEHTCLPFTVAVNTEGDNGHTIVGPSPSQCTVGGRLQRILPHAMPRLMDSETSSLFIFIATLVDRHHCTHFTDEKMETLNN